MASIQPCLRKLGVNLCYYNGKEIWPRNITGRHIASKIHNNHFCLVWKPENLNSNKANNELKDNFKIVDNYVTEQNVKSHFENKYTPKKLEIKLTNFITY